jgi:thiamine biosynthesis lipoprotein
MRLLLVDWSRLPQSRSLDLPIRFDAVCRAGHDPHDMICIDSSVAPPSDPDVTDVDSRLIASAPTHLWRFHDEYVLGTRLEVLVNAHSAALARAAAHAARAEIARLDRVFNHRSPESEVARLNRSSSAVVSEDLFAVVQASEIWRRITRGSFDGRIGELIELWRSGALPSERRIAAVIATLRAADVALDATARTIARPAGVRWSLDAIAKGYIVDAAMNAARRAAPFIEGLALDIGGDIRTWGAAPDARGWRVGVADALRPADNAPLVDAVVLRNAAIATSGRGPRDRVHGAYRSTTLSPLTGCPVRDVVAASVVASHAIDADAIATTCMVMSPAQSLALVDSLEGVAARITNAQGDVLLSSRWPLLQLAAAATTEQRGSSVVNASPSASEQHWPHDWELGIRYIAPDRNEAERSADFRSPYMAMWITDADDRPVHTLFLLGTSAEWQRENFVWWSMHRNRAKQLIDLRSQATALSGRYNLYWNGRDDDWKPLPVGKYTLHLETSQERGKHTHRSLPLELGHKRIKVQMPSIPGAGGLKLYYGHYNERFELDE